MVIVIAGSTGTGVGVGVGTGVGIGVGTGVGRGVGTGVGTGVGAGVSTVGISVACAAAHNAGQLAAAALLLKSPSVFSYYPVLTMAAAVTGSISGILLSVLLPALRNTVPLRTDAKEV